MKTIALGYSLAKANFKLRNEGSYLGIFWYLLNPLALFLSILFVKHAIFSSVNIAYYPIYLIIGLTMLNFFTQVVRSSISLVQSNASFIKSIQISYTALVVSAVFQAMFSHLFELVLVICMLLYFKISIIGIAGYLVLFVLYSIFAFGVCLMTCVLGAHVNDLTNIWTPLSQLLVFITPTFYEIQPGASLYTVSKFNPLWYFIQAGRELLIMQHIPSILSVGIILCMSLASCLIGLCIFRRYSVRFAELV